MEDSTMMKATAKDRSPIDSALEQNGELIAAIEKQVEVLAQRLAPVSILVPENEEAKDHAAVRGNSPIVESIGAQVYKLSNISDRLSRVTRNLEI